MPRVPVQTQQPAGGGAAFDAPRVIPYQDATAQQTQEAGAALASLGASAYRIGKARQDEINTAYALDRANVAQDSLRKLLRDPEKGYLNLRGEDAVRGHKATSEQLDEQIEQLRGSLENDEQRDAFDRAASQMRQRALVDIDGHLAVQSRNFYTSRLSAAIELQKAKWVESQSDDAEGLIRNYVQELRDLAGAPQEVADNELREHLSEMHSKRLDSLEDHGQMVAYMKEHGGKMSPALRKAAQERITKEGSRQKGQLLAEDLFARKMAPRDAREAMAQLRNRGEISFETWEAAQSRFERLDAQVQMEENRLAAEVLDDAKNTVLGGGQLSQKQLSRLEATKQDGIMRAFIASNNKHETSLYGHEEYAWFHTDEGEKRLKSMTPEQLATEYRGHMTDEKFGWLLAKNRELRGKPDAGDAVQIGRDRKLWTAFQNSAGVEGSERFLDPKEAAKDDKGRNVAFAYQKFSDAVDLRAKLIQGNKPITDEDELYDKAIKSVLADRLTPTSGAKLTALATAEEIGAATWRMPDGAEMRGDQLFPRGPGMPTVQDRMTKIIAGYEARTGRSPTMQKIAEIQYQQRLTIEKSQKARIAQDRKDALTSLQNDYRSILNGTATNADGELMRGVVLDFYAGLRQQARERSGGILNTMDPQRMTIEQLDPGGDLLHQHIVDLVVGRASPAVRRRMSKIEMINAVRELEGREPIDFVPVPRGMFSNKGEKIPVDPGGLFESPQGTGLGGAIKNLFFGGDR